jgi:hypothetical protein
MKIPFGKILLSLISLALGVGAWVADYNETHVFNPNWPPHAKFHNGQTMFFGSFMGLMCLVFLWTNFLKVLPKQKVILAAIFPVLYFMTQFGAYFIPGAALRDPEFATGTWSNDNSQLYLALENLVIIILAVSHEIWRLNRKKNLESQN